MVYGILASGASVCHALGVHLCGVVAGWHSAIFILGGRYLAVAQYAARTRAFRPCGPQYARVIAHDDASNDVKSRLSFARNRS